MHPTSRFRRSLLACLDTPYWRIPMISNGGFRCLLVDSDAYSRIQTPNRGFRCLMVDSDDIMVDFDA